MEKYMSQVEEITLDEVYADEKVEPEVVTEEVVTEEPEVDAETPEPEVETTSAEPEKSWTFSQAMDEREKRQKFETENTELKAKLAEFDKTEDVSVFTDEEAFKQQLKDNSKADLDTAILGMSKAYAARELGAETVEKAAAWYAEEGMKSPYMMQQIHDSDLKFHKVVELYEQEQMRLDPEKARAAMKAEILAELKPKASEGETESITPSLASQRSAGKTQEKPSDWGDILDEK
jgi:hypothetical protein